MQCERLSVLVRSARAATVLLLATVLAHALVATGSVLQQRGGSAFIATTSDVSPGPPRATSADITLVAGRDPRAADDPPCPLWMLAKALAPVLPAHVGGAATGWNTMPATWRFHRIAFLPPARAPPRG